MVVEYMLLLMISLIILTGAFGLTTGPIAMFKEKSPYLARKVEKNLMTGNGFYEKKVKQKDQWKAPN